MWLRSPSSWWVRASSAAYPAPGGRSPQARSSYSGGQVPGKPPGFMLYAGGLRSYSRLLEDGAAGGYAGVALRKD